MSVNQAVFCLVELLFLFIFFSTLLTGNLNYETSISSNNFQMLENGYWHSVDLPLSVNTDVGHVTIQNVVLSATSN